MGKIFLLMGPSSAGKDTIYKKLIEIHPDFKPIVLYTNRPIRENEIDGINYNFVSLEEIRNMEQQNQILEKREYDTIYGVWVYATAKTNIDIENNNYIGMNTLEGFNKLYEYYQDSIIPFLIYVDDGIRLTRALEREKLQTNPKYSEMCRRFLADCEDFSEEKLSKSFPFYTCSNNTNNVMDCVNEINIKIEEEIQKQKKKVL